MLGINEERFLGDLKALWQIGATVDGGVTRRAFSAEDVLGRQWFEQRVRDAGLQFYKDGAANLFAILPSQSNPNGPTLLCGSHLDTVPNGGRYDGSLGTLCALEALRTIQEAGIDLPFNLSAVSFTDEEGSLHGLFGSQALAGIMTSESLTTGRGSGEGALAEGLARLGISAETTLAARQAPENFTAYVEVHIEQGTRLEKSNTDIGVVTGIVGIRSAMLTFTGEAAHAGAKPMNERRDALWGAASFLLKARELVQARFHPGVCNFGQISAEPNAFNIVPERVQLALEFRHGTEQLLDDMQTVLFELARGVSADFDLTLDIEEFEGCDAAPSAEIILQAIETVCDNNGLSHKRMMSFAGHDAQSMAKITPSAMIFVPSVGGVSHRHNELTKDADCVNGANALLHTLLTLMKHESTR
ncbi:MAG: Zn-dependent hydrolase [Candidatus Promineifilaceae bacterium]